MPHPLLQSLLVRHAEESDGVVQDYHQKNLKELDASLVAQKVSPIEIY